MKIQKKIKAETNDVLLKQSKCKLCNLIDVVYKILSKYYTNKKI